MGLDKTMIRLVRRWIPAFAGMTALFAGLARAADIQCVSLDISSGTVGQRTNYNHRISGDGGYLLFTSNATIYRGLKNGITRQVYLFDNESKSLELITRSFTEKASPETASGEWVSTDEPGNRPSGDPRVSFNGRYAAFKSAATNLTRLLPLDSLASHLYLLDRRQNQMIQVDETERG